jgi:hypothetical protein
MNRASYPKTLKSKYGFVDVWIIGFHWRSETELAIEFDLGNTTVPRASIVFMDVENRKSIEQPLAELAKNKSNVDGVLMLDRTTCAVGPLEIVCGSVYVP